MTTSEDFVATALTQRGKPYVYGSDAQPLDPDPANFDCAQLAYWALGRLGIVAPSYSWGQWPWALPHITVDQAMHTRGALIFMGARTTVHHVVISLGDGTTIEARGKAWGVGCWAVTGRPFDGAGLVPGLTYIGTPAGTAVNHGGGIGIQPGASSPQAVSFLQSMLNLIRAHQTATGTPRRQIAVDGSYENETKAAVAEFQTDYDHVFHPTPLLKVTGGADPATSDAIAVSVRLITRTR